MIQMIKNKRTQGKINIDYGMKDYYKYFKKNSKYNISNSIYTKVIENFNKEIIRLILEESLDYKIPHIGCTLSVRKSKNTPKIVNGKVINKNPVDWKTTNKLWSEDEEAEDKKLLVRHNNYHTSGYVFKIFLKKFNNHFKNKRFYRFKPARDFSRALCKRIKDENKVKFDAYKLY